MKIIHYKLLMAVLLISSTAFAQQESAFAFFSSHMNIVNPAYTGIDNETMVSSSLRKQWTGIQDAPETQAVSFGMPAGKNLGIGLSLVNDKTFIERQTFLGVDFSYKVKINANSNLYLGIKAGGNFYAINTTGLDTYDLTVDPALASIAIFNPNLGVGAVFKQDKWYASLSVPRMLSTNKARNQAGYAMVATDRPHVYLSAGTEYELEPDIILKPSVMVQYVNSAPISITINSMVQLDQIFEIGMLYRSEKAFGVLSSFKLSRRLLFGFAYEMSNQRVLASAKNTNEIFLQFKF